MVLLDLSLNLELILVSPESLCSGLDPTWKIGHNLTKCRTMCLLLMICTTMYLRGQFSILFSFLYKPLRQRRSSAHIISPICCLLMISNYVVHVWNLLLDILNRKRLFSVLSGTYTNILTECMNYFFYSLSIYESFRIGACLYMGLGQRHGLGSWGVGEWSR